MYLQHPNVRKVIAGVVLLRAEEDYTEQVAFAAVYLVLVHALDGAHAPLKKSCFSLFFAIAFIIIVVVVAFVLDLSKHAARAVHKKQDAVAERVLLTNKEKYSPTIEFCCCCCWWWW